MTGENKIGRISKIVLTGTLLLTGRVFAAQSLVLTPGATGGYSVPSAAPYNNLGDFRLEFRIHDWSRASVWTTIMSLPQFQVRFIAGQDRVAVTDWVDEFTSGQGNAISVSVQGRQDFFIRFQRRMAEKRLVMEVWNADGTNYAVAQHPMDAAVLRPITGYAEVGGPQTSARLAYYRWYSGSIATGGRPVSTGPGDLGNWEFEGSTADSSGRGLHVSISGQYTSTPTYPPACHAGTARSFRAGYPAALDGSGSFPLTDGGTLTYFWQQLRGPTSVIWEDQKTSRPTISGLVTGTYEFQLTVTDNEGRSSQCQVSHGSVATDANGVVLVGDPAMAELLGPMTIWGTNPWPWFDDRHKRLADLFGALQDSDYLDVWNFEGPGTISVIAGSSSITGTDTTFRATFCNGGSTPPPETHIVVWYTEGSRKGRRAYLVASCESDTQLRLANGYLGKTESELNYSTLPGAVVGTWINGSTNANYYDNVLAFYSLYYRSGLEIYRDYARTLAVRWWTMPFIDEGRASVYYDHGGQRVLAPRLRSLTGLVARALDGRPEMWTGLEMFAADAVASETQTSPPGDIRENGYNLSVIALSALFHPDESKRRGYVQALETSIRNRWGPHQRAEGQWDNPTYGYAPWNGYPGTVTVVHGSTTVTGEGTAWQPSWVQGNFFLICDVSGNGCDTTAYTATYVSPTQLVLDRPYEGASGSARGWQLSNLVGFGTQPFMMGILGTAMHWAYMALQRADSPLAPTVRQYVLDIANWIINFGYSPTAKGLYYGRNYPGCEPISDDRMNCGASPAEDARFLNSEVMNVLAAAYLLTGDNRYRTYGDAMYAAMWAKPGDPEADSLYLRTYEDNGWSLVTKKAKDFGFAFGIGMGSGWPAARIGGALPRRERRLLVAPDTNLGASASSVRLRLTQPDGLTTETNCQNSPCALHIDPRQGDHVLTLSYESAAGHSLSQSEPLLIKTGE